MKIAILTGGGDCPGMNAFIRAASRSALNLIPGCAVFGVLDGWAGLLTPRYRSIDAIDTAGINRLGGTILGTMRAPELAHDRDAQERLTLNFIESGFDALLVCGGNGSLRAAHLLDRQLREQGHHRPILFTPASIDNDVANTLGTALGFYSALTRSLEMMEWIRDTASAHRRVYLIGSMGRSSAYLPFYAGIASGAEYVIRPNENVDFDAIVHMIEARDRDTRIIVSEAYPKSLDSIRAILTDALEKRQSRHEIRTVDMGYFQRGGEASVTDALRANWLAYNMVKSVRDGEGSGFFGAFHVGTPPCRASLEEALSPSANHEDIPRDMIEMALAIR